MGKRRNPVHGCHQTDGDISVAQRISDVQSAEGARDLKGSQALQGRGKVRDRDKRQAFRACGSLESIV